MTGKARKVLRNAMRDGGWKCKGHEFVWLGPFKALLIGDGTKCLKRYDGITIDKAVDISITFMEETLGETL